MSLPMSWICHAYCFRGKFSYTFPFHSPSLYSHISRREEFNVSDPRYLRSGVRTTITCRSICFSVCIRILTYSDSCCVSYRSRQHLLSPRFWCLKIGQKRRGMKFSKNKIFLERQVLPRPGLRRSIDAGLGYLLLMWGLQIDQSIDLV